MRTFKFERLSADDTKKFFPSLWATAAEALPNMSDEQLAVVVSLVIDNCPSCHERDRGCMCWDDE